MKRTDATATDRVGGDVEGIAETDRLGAVEDLIEVAVWPDASDGLMEEAGSDFAGGIDDSGDPGRVTSRCVRLILGERQDAAKFLGAFKNESAAFAGGNEMVDLLSEHCDFGLGEMEMRDVAVWRMIECGRVRIDGEERN